MKAMVLAAGLGTRLRPLTHDRPKALVEIGGRTLIEITLAWLRDFGIRDVVINAHHFAEKLVEYLEAHDNFGMRIEISREDVLLDTGGGLKKAAHFFMAGANKAKPTAKLLHPTEPKAGSAGAPVRSARQPGTAVPTRAPAVQASEEPIVIHNVDVISRIDLTRMAEAHTASQALATLAVQDRPTSRYLIFDEQLQLCGRRIERKAKEEIAKKATTGIGRNAREEIVRGATEEMVRKPQHAQALAFAGIHIVSPRLLPKLTEQGAFSIITSYLRLAGQGEKILGFRADEYYWRDVGRREDLKRAEQELAKL